MKKNTAQPSTLAFKGKPTSTQSEASTCRESATRPAGTSSPRQACETFYGSRTEDSQSKAHRKNFILRNEHSNAKPHPSLEANQCVAWGRCASIPWAHVLVDAEGNCWWTVLQHVSTNIRTRAVDVELAAAQTPQKWYASELRPPVLHETIAFTSQQAAATRPSKPFL